MADCCLLFQAGPPVRAEPVQARRAFCGMHDKPVYDEPSKVDAEDGAVAVKGPDQVDVELTPEAAEETSNRLLEGSLRALRNDACRKRAAG